MSCNFTEHNYVLQAKKRVNDPQVGEVLRKVYDIEQIIVTNKGQFYKFYKITNDVELPEELSMEEVNRIKLEIVKNLLSELSNKIEGGEYHE